MLYIAALVERNKDGNLELSGRPVSKGPDMDAVLLGASERPGQVVALWEYEGGPLKTADARAWAQMTLPDRIYMHTDQHEFMRASDHYRIHMGD